MFPTIPAFRPCVALGCALLFASCGSMKDVTAGASNGLGKVGSGIGEGFGKVADFTMSPFRPGVPVVEAREDALRELPSGQQQAIAYQQKQNSFWSFLGPINFKEPALPSDPGAMDGGLLPPIE